jgi:hypothetical protein
MQKNTAKNGRGRPASAEPGMVAISAMIDEESMARLRAAAKAEDRSISNLLRMVVRRGLAEMQPVCGSQKGGTER